MTPILLLSLLGLSFFAVSLDSSGDELLDAEDDALETDEATLQPENEGTDVDTGDTDVEDEEGDEDDANDTVEAGNQEAVEEGVLVETAERINFDDANDVVTLVEGAERASIATSGGDDVVNVFGTNSFVDTEEGNDTIRAMDARGTDINAGEGDDVFFLDGAGRLDDGSDYLEAEGQDGNDTFTIAEGSTDLRVEGNDGNDTITGSSSNGIFSGGAGDDVLTLTGEGFRASGDEGNDTITVRDGETGTFDTVEAGNGDDLITIERNDQGFAHEGVDVRGDGGDDTIVAQTLLDVDGDLDVIDTLEGGDDADTFDLSFYLPEGVLPGEASDAGVVINILDFISGEDTLLIQNEITDPSGEGLGLLLDEEIEIEQLTDIRSTDVKLTYASEDGSSQITLTVRLDDVRDTDFSASDLQIV